MESKLTLTPDYDLIGFNSEADMNDWIQKFNSMDGHEAPPFFKDCCAYMGLADDCKPQADWVEKKGKMDSGGDWYKPYDDNKYCYNHFRWSFISALKAIGNPEYIIVLNTKKITAEALTTSTP